MRLSPLFLVAFLFLAIFLLAFIQVGVLTIAVDKLGLPPIALIVLLFGSLLGSGVNIPLFSMRTEPPPAMRAHPLYRLGLLRPRQPFTGRTRVAINLGGGVIPIGFAIYLWLHHPLSLLPVFGAIAVVAAISYVASRPVPGMGVAMPLFVGPIAAAVTALILGGELSAPLAYICGTLGVLVGADLLRIGDISQMGTPLASIGGAGTFDGIYITGIVAVLLA
ncbi:DUF1614 domain-containing protein [Thiohalorhabdus sp.]|uniref:DUF1614 domain-containing protein n=1 Tax=Thiohalorhabdus sp. TaxID=3094134 RepID=UPI002FC2E78E